MTSGLSYYNSLEQSFSNTSVWLIIIITMFIEIPVNANSVGPDQMPHPGASGLDQQFASYPFRVF